MGGMVNPVDAGDALTPAERGLENLRHHSYIPPHFNDEILKNLWQTWPVELREQAQNATPVARRKMIFDRYGLIPANDDPASYEQLCFVKDSSGQLAMSCLTCHSGKVAGRIIPGLGNSILDLSLIIDEVRAYKQLKQIPLVSMDYSSMVMPMGETRGLTNAVIFGVVLGNFRDKEMRVITPKLNLQMQHHDMDAPPWWHLKKKSHMYLDGLAEKNPRLLMQFMMVRTNPAEKIYSWENEFRDIEAYIESLTSPAYPFAIDKHLAASGERVFTEHCASCHGTYGANSTYPEVTVPIREIGTDPVRLNSLSVEHRGWLKDSWMTNHGRTEIVTDPGGYVAPPLDGVWATAPYLHNGSVPTLWHLLHVDQRPEFWRRTSLDGYDQQKIGLVFEILPDDFENESKDPAAEHQIYDTLKKGKSARGHDFPQVLNEAEKAALLEYLKSL
jgi:mono/diheme cytochrome c family protein